MISLNKICSEIYKLLKSKNKMYGDSFKKTLDEYGNVMICIRIEDKLNRLKQIIIKGLNDSETDERLADTLKDLAGYSVLSLYALLNKNDINNNNNDDNEVTNGRNN